MRAAALGALERCPRACLRDDQQRTQVDRGVPAGIVLAAPRYSHFARPRLELLELTERSLEPTLIANDSRMTLHHDLQRRLHRERILAVALERLQRLPHRLLDLGIRDRQRCAAPAPPGCV